MFKGSITLQNMKQAKTNLLTCWCNNINKQKLEKQSKTEEKSQNSVLLQTQYIDALLSGKRLYRGTCLLFQTNEHLLSRFITNQTFVMNKCEQLHLFFSWGGDEYV